MRTCGLDTVSAIASTYSTTEVFYNLTTLSFAIFLVAFLLSNTNFAALTIAS